MMAETYITVICLAANVCPDSNTAVIKKKNECSKQYIMV